MKPAAWWTLWWFGILVCLTPALAFWQTRDSTYNLVSTGGFSASCSQSAAYIAATSLDATHKTAIDTLICGRVTSGVFAKMDVWNMLATTNAADALKNMAQPGTFDSTVISTPTFVPNGGYNGVDASTTIALDTHFNPTTSTGACTNGSSGHPCFLQDSAHLSAWSNTNALSGASGGIMIGITSASVQSRVLARYSTGSAFYDINSNSSSGGFATADSLGHYVATRSAPTVNNGYKNAVDQSVVVRASAALPSANIYVLANDDSTIPGPSFGSALQIMTFSIGGSLTAGDVTDLCHATNVYLTTVAGVSAGAC